MNVNKDVTATHSEPLSERLTKEIVLHLSKEIETASNNMMTFRTRIGFGLLVGPFVLLGSLVVGAKGQRISFNLNGYGWLGVIGMLFCYLGIGYIASRIEAQAWEQNDRWRNLITKLYQNPSARIEATEMETRPHKSYAGYFAGYSLLFLSVVASVCIVNSAGTPEFSLAFHGLPPMWAIYVFCAVMVGLLVAIFCALVWRFSVIKWLKDKWPELTRKQTKGPL